MGAATSSESATSGNLATTDSSDWYLPSSVDETEEEIKRSAKAEEVKNALKAKSRKFFESIAGMRSKVAGTCYSR
jgi:hypothetical protein